MIHPHNSRLPLLEAAKHEMSPALQSMPSSIDERHKQQSGGLNTSKQLSYDTHGCPRVLGYNVRIGSSSSTAQATAGLNTSLRQLLEHLNYGSHWHLSRIKCDHELRLPSPNDKIKCNQQRNDIETNGKIPGPSVARDYVTTVSRSDISHDRACNPKRQ